MTIPHLCRSMYYVLRLFEVRLGTTEYTVHSKYVYWCLMSYCLTSDIKSDTIYRRLSILFRVVCTMNHVCPSD